jgi:hypothetical protein
MPCTAGTPEVFGPFDGDFDPFDEEEDAGMVITFGHRFGGCFAIAAWAVLAVSATFTASTAVAQQTSETVEAVRRYFDLQALGPEAHLQGEYAGLLAGRPVGVQVVARGESRFHAFVLPGGLPGDGWDGSPYVLLESDPLENGTAAFYAVAAADCTSASLDNQGFRLTRAGQTVVLPRVERTSSTLGQAPPAGAVVLFDGTGLDAFQQDTRYEAQTTPLMLDGNMLNGGVTKQSFGDCVLHVEFMTGFEPENIPWRRADAGIYLASRYEVAIGDSFGFDFDLSGFGGPTAPRLFSQRSLAQKFPVTTGARHATKPRVCGSVFTYPVTVPNTCHPPLTWQTLDIDFTAPRFDAAGVKTADAILSVKLNGHQIVNRQQVSKPTPHGLKGEVAKAPIWFEAFFRRVLYRNIWLVEKP